MPLSPEIPSSVADIVAFVGHGFSCQAFWNYKTLEEVCLPLKKSQWLQPRYQQAWFWFIRGLCRDQWVSGEVGPLLKWWYRQWMQLLWLQKSEDLTCPLLQDCPFSAVRPVYPCVICCCFVFAFASWFTTLSRIEWVYAIGWCKEMVAVAFRWYF